MCRFLISTLSLPPIPLHSAELQQMVDMEREASSTSAAAAAVDMAEMLSMKKEITRLEVEVEQGRMHIKELLLTQKLERTEHAQVL